MKKLSVIFIIGLLLVGIIISCDNKVNDNINETVSISFNKLSSRDISSSVENFDATKLYWKYSAKKNSADNNPNLNSGSTFDYDSDTTGAVEIGKGLNATLSGFSQGLWDFKLFAYKDEGYSKLAYGGEATGVRLEWGYNNVVDVEVSPYIDKDKGNGTIDLSELTVKCNETVISNWSISSVSFNPTTTSSFSGNKLTNVSPGTYTITITIKNDDGTVYDPLTLNQNITVYSNLTTTVTGEITVVASSPAVPPGLNLIGGVIFYVAGGNGATYTFYDKDGTKIEKSFSVENLIDAKYYKVSGKSETAADRFFVLYPEKQFFTNDTVYWGFYNKDFSEITEETTGKSNTNTILKYIEDNKLKDETPEDYSDTSTTEYRNCGTTGKYMWDLLIDFNDSTKIATTGNKTGLYDWYIPSKNEIDNIFVNRSKIKPIIGENYFPTKPFFISSSEYSTTQFRGFNWSSATFASSNKNAIFYNGTVLQYDGVVIRSF